MKRIVAPKGYDVSQEGRPREDTPHVRRLRARSSGRNVLMVSGAGLAGVVVIGASAGGVEAITRLVSTLPADLPYAVMVVLHMPAQAPSVLPRIVDRAGPLQAVAAQHGSPLEAGQVYVATPDHHLLIDGDHVAVTKGPTENGHRPAINALFRSAALAFGPRAIGVLLSGVLDDGVLGLSTIRARGGTTLCQALDDALFPTLPSNAMEAEVVDHVSAAGDMGTLITDLSKRDIEDLPMEPDDTLELENRIAMSAPFSSRVNTLSLGPPSGYTCPDCNGSLQTIDDAGFRCRVGHAWTAESLLQARDDEVQAALWIAVRSLEEKAAMARTLAGKVSAGMISNRYTTAAHEAEHALAVLRERLTTLEEL